MSNLISKFIAFPLFGVLVTVIAFYVGQQLYLKSNRHPVLQPVIIALILVVGLVLLLDVPYQTYYESSYILHTMLGPATVALAIPLYQNAKRIRDLIFPILCTVLVAGSLTVLLAVGILWLFGTDTSTLLSMTTKSITTPIAMIVSDQIGGIPAMSAMFVILTGAIGAMVGIPIMNWLKIEDQGVRGFTMGLTSHALGTARALEENEECAAFSALAMSLTGVMTAVLLPFVVAWFI